MTAATPSKDLPEEREGILGGDNLTERECPFCSWVGPSNKWPAHLSCGECPGPSDDRRPSAGGVDE